MARWESDAVGRLQAAAMELYRDPGYDKVTVADIAARAGLTRRTFFRYFADKREVLFFGTDRVNELVAGGIMAARDGTGALEAVAMGLAAIAQLSDDDPAHAEYVRLRHRVIQANGELIERELAKHASLAAHIAETLSRRGIAPSDARLAAEVGLAAFKIGFEGWVKNSARRPMGTYVRDAMRAVGQVVSGSVALAPVAVAPTRRERRR